MNTITGCDARRCYSVFAVFDASTSSVQQIRVNHQLRAINAFLADFPNGTPDERELQRIRMAFAKVRAALKNRIHAALAKYALNTSEHSDIFAGQGRFWLHNTLKRLRPKRAAA